MTQNIAPSVELIPVDRILVVNPRVRNKKTFKEIVSNIAELGLKRPITVAKRDSADAPRYDLVCGQGRLEAYRILGQQEIPALSTCRGRRSSSRATYVKLPSVTKKRLV
jgi:ParB family transcriptional regulator, chromosome partitioning protein